MVSFFSVYVAWCRGILVSSGKPPRYLLPHFCLLGVAPRQDHLEGYWPWPRRRCAALPPRRSRSGAGENQTWSQPRRSVSVQDIHCDGLTRIVRNCVESPNSSSFLHWWPSVQHASLLQKLHRSSCWRLPGAAFKATSRCTWRQWAATWRLWRCCSMPAPPWLPRTTLGAVALKLGWNFLLKGGWGRYWETGHRERFAKRRVGLRMFEVDPTMTCLRESCVFSCRLKSSIAAHPDLSPATSKVTSRCILRSRTATRRSSRCCSMPRPLWMPRAGSAVAPVRM